MEILKCLLLALLTTVLTAVHAQDDQSGFISLDCGSPDEDSAYTDKTTHINYISDSRFIESGISRTISPSYKINSLAKQLWYLRAFPQGTRNCYTLWPRQGKGNKYLIRASFLYGNYDAKKQPPDFDLHLGVNKWEAVAFKDDTTPTTAEIIHVPSADYINVCLVKTGVSTPFISALELRLLNDTIYTTQFGSLQLFLRNYFVDSETNYQSVRYKDDLYDRIWTPFEMQNFSTISTVSNILHSNSYQVPSAVMRSASTPLNPSEPLRFYWDAKDSSDQQYYVYMHFAELVELQANQSREFNLYLNNNLWYKEESIVPPYLGTITVYSTSPATGSSRYEVSIIKTRTSTLPPIINAIEIFTVKRFLDMETDHTDVSAMLSIKSMYKLTRNWQGDPCAPQAFVWDGLNCSYEGFQLPRITSLDLSSSGLNGEIAPYISNLTMIQSLDLSNNNLTGELPDFLGQLASLKTVNLKGNNFTGSIPAQLLEKSKNGLLTLSVNGLDSNSNPCKSGSCKKKKTQIVVPVIASLAALMFVLCAALVTLWIKKRKQRDRKGDAELNKKEGILETKNRQFTYSELLRITNNFKKVIGKGGFGTVYHGYVGDTQVAVKMLSPSSTQGYKEFQAEASLLTSVHHKNLSTLVGYCNEGANMGIIYEYMANGNLDMHLSDRNLYTMGWEERLRIATDAAHGLEYLHHGCKPPIVHRDVKSNNILLNEKFQAKLTDFGLSRAFPVEGGTHVSTIVAGTPGYLDPEYCTSNRLTEKSDVYGFGIVLLEIITGRPAIAKTQDRTHIVKWVKSTLQNGDVSNIVDPRLKGDFDVNSAWKAVEIAMACASRVSSKRPTMDTVVLELKECLATVRHNEDASYTESKDSIGLISVNVESGRDPGAR